MKKNTIFTALFLLSAGWLAAQEPDHLMQPSNVEARVINSAGEITLSHEAYFTYDGESKLYTFDIPDFGRHANFSYTSNNGFRQWDIHQFNPNYNDWANECNRFTYDSNDRLVQLEEFASVGNTLYFDGYVWKYQYNDDGRVCRKEFYDWPCFGTTLLANYWIYDYANNGLLATRSEYEVNQSNTYLHQVVTYQHSNDYDCLSEQTDTYNHDGEITQSVLLTYTYGDAHQLVSMKRQLLVDNEWANRNITLYSYDNQGRQKAIQFNIWSDSISDWINQTIETNTYDEEGRITEVGKGEWIDGDWYYNKKTVYEYDLYNGRYTVSFYKKNSDDQWVWDIFRSEPLFFDDDLNWQQKCLETMTYENLYNHTPIIYYNQFEMTMMDTPRPPYMSVDDHVVSICTVFPNPGKESVTVKAPMENAVVRLYDLQGRQLLAKPFDFQTTVNTGDWAPGIYLWEVWNGPHKEASGKWVKE